MLRGGAAICLAAGVLIYLIWPVSPLTDRGTKAYAERLIVAEKIASEFDSFGFEMRSGVADAQQSLFARLRETFPCLEEAQIDDIKNEYERSLEDQSQKVQSFSAHHLARLFSQEDLLYMYELGQKPQSVPLTIQKLRVDLTIYFRIDEVVDEASLLAEQLGGEFEQEVAPLFYELLENDPCRGLEATE